MEIYTPLGPTIKEQALRSCLGVLSPFSYCPHSENTVGCGLEALHLCLLTHTGYDLCCHLGADLPVVVVLLLSQDDTRFATINAVCPKYKRETEGGRSFAVTAATKLWNNLPLHTRKLDSVTCLRKNMFARIFKEQLTLKHFVV